MLQTSIKAAKMFLQLACCLKWALWD